MRNISPRIVGPLCEVAKDQPQYQPVVVIPAVNPRHPLPRHNAVIMCFEPTAEDRQRVINGENIYVALLTNGAPQQPILITVGPEDMAAWHNLSVPTREGLQVDSNPPACEETTCMIQELLVGDTFYDEPLDEWLPVKEVRHSPLGVPRYREIRVSDEGRALSYNRTEVVRVRRA
jgi:hypothetical protein